ncbi:cilia- and flagella-associated protein 410 isoform X1 [Bufo gargarizans]|uniref:cilia- and flagella-associated protein 410 isoform X1 n=2 Tax=Bufo gargarizans TaxID=30331 RepID=UPI001CF2B3A6|nr:cilia- and flagella-associated protein 410 isoform X1 [Bufo gargarizans]
MKLTRKQVLSRAKASELDSVKKLNCWGSRLTDISICHELSNIEVMTLSANNIFTLEPISHCQNLTELYLRKNNVSNLTELYFLKNLPKLKVLWLSENPCCNPDPHKYRMTVLRNLPNLQKLDNQAVTAEEVSHAMTEGEEITAAPTKISSTENGSPGPTPEHTCGEVTAESESDLLNFSMEETNKIREQLGMKPLPRDKFSPFSSPVEPYGNRKRKNNVLNAILLLLKDLDAEGLEIVQRTAENRVLQLQRKGL